MHGLMHRQTEGHQRTVSNSSSAELKTMAISIFSFFHIFFNLFKYRNQLQLKSTDAFNLEKFKILFVKELKLNSRASDIFPDWWARITHGAKYGGSFSEMSRPIIYN